MTARLQQKYTTIFNLLITPKFDHESAHGRLTNQEAYDKFVLPSITLGLLVPSVGSMVGHLVQAKEARTERIPNSRRTQCNNYASGIIKTWRKVMGLEPLGKLEDAVTNKERTNLPKESTVESSKNTADSLSAFLDLSKEDMETFRTMPDPKFKSRKPLFPGLGDSWDVLESPLCIGTPNNMASLNKTMRAVYVHRSKFRDEFFRATMNELGLSLSSHGSHCQFQTIKELGFHSDMKYMRTMVKKFIVVYNRHKNN